MAEGKKKTRKAGGDGSLIAVDANKLREALKHTFEGVTMLFDCFGVDAQVGAPVMESEGIVELPISETKGKKEAANAQEKDAAPAAEKAPDSSSEPVASPVSLEQSTTAAETTVPEAPPVEQGSAQAATVTQDDITRIIVRKIKQDRSNNEKIGAILKTYGVSKVSDLPAVKYEAFLTDLSQI